MSSAQAGPAELVLSSRVGSFLSVLTEVHAHIVRFQPLPISARTRPQALANTESHTTPVRKFVFKGCESKGEVSQDTDTA